MTECDEEQQQRNLRPHKCYEYSLLRDVHRSLPPPTTNASNTSTHITQGNFSYFHYGCDGFMDNGWGCAYRTLQSICSWIEDKRNLPESEQKVPTIREIQESLVRIGDKSVIFVGSKDWIGALEVFYVLDLLYDVPCKIVHVARRDDLKKYINVLKQYFQEFGGLVMMGGDMDAASKGIAGVHISGNDAFLLIIDPHFVGTPKSAQDLIGRGYLRWQHTSEFVDSSFYNLCLPQLK